MKENAGITNIGRNLASGQTNLKNFKMILPSHWHETVTLKQGDGSNRLLEFFKNEDNRKHYRLIEQK